MAERRTRRAALQVSFDYTFDRLLESKLAQVYAILVPGRERLIGGSPTREFEYENGSDLRSSILGAATRGKNDRESDGGTDRVCQDSRPGSADGVGIRRRRI